MRKISKLIWSDFQDIKKKERKKSVKEYLMYITFDIRKKRRNKKIFMSAHLCNKMNKPGTNEMGTCSYLQEAGETEWKRQGNVNRVEGQGV